MRIVTGPSKWLQLVIYRLAFTSTGIIFITAISISVFFSACSDRMSDPGRVYVEQFDSPGSWTTGEGIHAKGSVIDGKYELSISPDVAGEVFWVTAGKNFTSGRFEVEAMPLEGTVDNGYGLLFRVNEEKDQFYSFKVSSDGFAFLGRCEKGCQLEEAIVQQDWFRSPAVDSGFNVTNHLRVDVNGSEMIFFVNGDEIGRAVDDVIHQGDIGLLAETFAPGGLRVRFDNVRVSPLSEE